MKQDKKIKNYKVLETLQPSGENANVYLVENESQQKFIIKHFRKSVKPYIGYGKQTHFGRRREGTREVFEEIKNISKSKSFLVNFYERFKWENRWCIAVEYVNGITLNDFILKYIDNNKKIEQIVKKLAKEVKLWHINNFALGDAHLNNVIIEEENESIRLIDYGQIHHPSFKYCKKFKCFEPVNRRIKEDIENKTGYFGKGFYTELINFEKRNNIDLSLGYIFKETYS